MIITNFSDLDLTKQYSYADYLLWQFSERVELIKGFIKKMSPVPSRKHQTVAKNITFKMMLFLEGKVCNLFFAPFDVRLPIPSTKKDSTVVQPDLCIICVESKLDDKGCNGSPDLIVEILSLYNSKYDVDTKFTLYQDAGVKEYWIVEPEEKLIFIYTLQEGVYIGLKPFSEGQIVTSPLFPELQISVDDVFYKV
jgi:Uma2 family endonuclease